MRGIRAEGKFVMGLYQFLKAVPQHNSVRPCWEAGGWQRRKGYLRGDALNKRQRDTAQLLAHSNRRCGAEVYMLGHQHLLSAGCDSLKKQLWNKKREK